MPDYRLTFWEDPNMHNLDINTTNSMRERTLDNLDTCHEWADIYLRAGGMVACYSVGSDGVHRHVFTRSR